MVKTKSTASSSAVDNTPLLDLQKEKYELVKRKLKIERLYEKLKTMELSDDERNKLLSALEPEEKKK